MRQKLAKGDDILGVAPTLDRALARLEAGDLPIPREVQRELLAFLHAREDEVSLMRMRTYTLWLPVVAQKLGAELLAPTRETPQHYREAFQA